MPERHIIFAEVYSAGSGRGKMIKKRDQVGEDAALLSPRVNPRVRPGEMPFQWPVQRTKATGNGWILFRK